MQYSFSHWVLMRLHIRLREDVERDRDRWGRKMRAVLFFPMGFNEATHKDERMIAKKLGGNPFHG